MQPKLTPRQQEVWGEIQRFAQTGQSAMFRDGNEFHDTPGEMMPQYGSKVSRSTLEALERSGLIHITHEWSNYFILAATTN